MRKKKKKRVEKYITPRAVSEKRRHRPKAVDQSQRTQP